MAFRTENPLMTPAAFDRAARAVPSVETMTVNGVIVKTGFLLVICAVAGSVTWGMVGRGANQAMPWMMGGLIGGLVFALVASFAPRTAPWSAPVYAAFEGLFLGALSAIFEARYPGIAVTAVMLTLGALLAVLLLWRAGFVRAGGMVMKVVSVATVAIGLVYLVSMLMSLFGAGGLSILHEATPLGIAISVGICVIAALNFVWDFEFVEAGVARGAPKPVEWYAAFGVMVTLVWLYIEMLRLLSKLQRRR
jgi:uncharacterized YccA/Bax inhibitor family protein